MVVNGVVPLLHGGFVFLNVLFYEKDGGFSYFRAFVDGGWGGE